MTDKQIDVLLALNLRQMQMADAWEEGSGVWTEEIAAVCGLSARATAAVLTDARARGWVRGGPRSGDVTSWVLITGGVAALESNRERINARGKT